MPFKIAWYKSDTAESINYLKSNTTDLAITYNPAAEGIAIQQGIANDPAHYVFRDHFYLVGPPSNPANLSKDDDIRSMFAAIFEAGERNEDPPVRFLSRYDKSATNIKESQLWTEVGQVCHTFTSLAMWANEKVPWATAYSTWYHQYIAYPIQALQAAILLDEYTITDRGTHLSLPTGWQNRTVIYKAGTDDPSDPLLNPAHILIGVDADHAAMAEKFAQWAISSAGQNVTTGFKKNGEQLYTAAPKNTVYISGIQHALAS